MSDFFLRCVALVLRVLTYVTVLALPLAARAVDSTTVFNEVMYHPPGAADPEWIELHNQMAVNMDLSGWEISGGVNFKFPNGTIILAGGYLVVSSNPAALQASAGISGVLGPWTGSLNNAGETIRLRNRIDRVMDEFTFGDAGGFPVAADGGGVSLAKRTPGLASEDARSWTFSGQAGGSPGAENFPGGHALGPATTAITLADPWNFNQAGTNLGTNWAQTTYTAGAGGWQSGPGVFAFESDPVAAPVGTVLADPGTNVVTHYFQKSFTFSGDPTQTALQLTSLIDDGAVVSLNGFEVVRINMPSGTVDGTTHSTATVDNAVLSAPLTLPADHLIAGTNVLSVSVHAEPIGSGTNGGLVLVEQGGAINFTTDLALVSKGGTAFAKDLIGNGAYAPTHTISNLNNGSFSNGSSWIGNSPDSFCGIGLGATPRTIRSIAFGRDNTGTYADRTLGNYTLQYTTTPNPHVNPTAATWQTIGTLNYAGAGGTLFSLPARRHRFNFTAVQATGLRLICPGDGLTSGACIDEFEVYESAGAAGGGTSGLTLGAAAGFTLTWDGTSGKNLGGTVPVNFAQASTGATAFGSSELFFGGTHTIAHINDGYYGNQNSWISAGVGNEFIGVKFAGAVPFTRIAWGRDNLGTYSDRSIGTYTIQFTTVADPGIATPETGNAASGWKTIGSVAIAGGDPTLAIAQRHEFNVAPTGGGPITATGVRIKVSDPQICMDELEVAGPPQHDVVFGAQLISRPILPAAGSSPIVINEIGGANDATWRIEIRNTGATAVSLGGLVIASSNAPAGYTLPAQMLAPGALLVLDQTQLGFRPLLDDRVFLYNAGRTALLDAAAVKATTRARSGSDFLTPNAATFGAANTFNLHSEVVINEVMYHFPSNPTDNPEEWVELHNRSGGPVDISGWRLEGAFTFPTATSIPAGGFLVVANDAATLAAKWPEVATKIVGNFTGSLANSGERLVLKDANGNPANEVRYVTGGAWPALPDGGGSSLELRDPRADNSVGGAWAASNETSKTAWQTVTYRVTAGQTFGQNSWHEFRIGMLDTGECLIDDVSVVRDPDGAHQQIVQGGDFEAFTSKWRLLGNHGTSAIEAEAGTPSNHVLHVRATGPFGFNHNHIESTFAANAAIADGQTYEVSFRARWLSGSNLLNTRAYYARLAKTTALALPARLGTPGTVNSRFTANLGPTLTALAHAPAIPAATDPVTVSVVATDPDNVAGVTLRYALNGSASFSPVTMTAQGGGLYTGSVPVQGAGTIVQFYVEAQDALGAIAQMPAAGPDSRALYIVDDGQGSALSAHELRVIMLPADTTNLLAPLNRMSDARIGGTAIYRRSEVVYDIGVRLQGTAAGRIRDGEDFVGYDVAFPGDHLFRGVHDSVKLDRSGRAPVNRGQDEIYVKHMFNAAGVPCTYDDLCYFIAPQSVHTGTAILQMANYEKTFVDAQFGGDGTIFNLDGTYEPLTTTDGNPESLKNPVPLDTQLQTDFADLESDKEQYRGPLDIRAGRGNDDYTGLIGFCQTMSLPTAQLVTEIGAKMDVDEWMRCAALYSLCGINDCYMTGGFSHNLRVHVPSDGVGVSALPWDMDFVFNLAATSPAVLVGGNVRRIIDNSAPARRLYYGHLRDLCNTVFTSGAMAPWLAHYGSVVGQSMSGQAGYIDARRASVLAELPAPVPIAITTNGGAPFSVNATMATLEGTGWIDIRKFRRADTGAVLDATWTSDTTWQLTVGLSFGDNPITLEAYDFQGVLIGSQSITITSTLPAPAPRDFLRITELQYHPANPTGAETAVSADAEDFEFIELRNFGTEPLNIEGCRFTVGLDFTFPPGTTLALGENILVVRNVAAFQARYGTGPRIAGAYGPADALSNSGETITLVDAAGAEIQSFSYDDDFPWPENADGVGYSLVAIAPFLNLDRDLSTSWRSSVTVGGNPGTSDAATFAGNPNSDIDADGFKAFLEYALGTSDTQPNGSPLTLVKEVGGTFALTFKSRLNADDVALTIEASTTLSSFLPANAVPLTSTVNGTTLTQVWRITPPPGATRFFVRLRATAR